MKEVDLPSEALNQMRQEAFRELDQNDSAAAKRFYSHLISAISHPAAIGRSRIVTGTHSLQRKLNGLMLLRRAVIPFSFGASFIAFTYNKWLLVFIPLFLILDRFVLNHAQTKINVELYARLHVLDSLMESDENFRNKVLEEVDL